MTTDYEKEYKEASKRFKAWKEKYLTKETAFGDVIYDKTGEMQAEFNAIFPELAESEDERIRKEIIDYLHLVGKGDGDYAQPMIDRWIAWLEKQKINTEGDFGRGYDCGYQAGYAVGKNEMKPKVATATLDSEKQKEQKPVEWSEEDSKRYISIGTTLETSVVLSKEDYDANMAWLRELVNAKKYSGPRPSWKPSEEQMEALEIILRYGDKESTHIKNLTSLYNQLKKL